MSQVSAKNIFINTFKILNTYIDPLQQVIDTKGQYKVCKPGQGPPGTPQNSGNIQKFYIIFFFFFFFIFFWMKRKFSIINIKY